MGGRQECVCGGPGCGEGAQDVERVRCAKARGLVLAQERCVQRFPLRACRAWARRRNGLRCGVDGYEGEAACCHEAQASGRSEGGTIGRCLVAPGMQGGWDAIGARQLSGKAGEACGSERHGRGPTSMLTRRNRSTRARRPQCNRHQPSTASTQLPCQGGALERWCCQRALGRPRLVAQSGGPRGEAPARLLAQWRGSVEWQEPGAPSAFATGSLGCGV